MRHPRTSSVTIVTSHAAGGEKVRGFCLCFSVRPSRSVTDKHRQKPRSLLFLVLFYILCRKLFLILRRTVLIAILCFVLF